jgi:hypothetical protein
VSPPASSRGDRVLVPKEAPIRDGLVDSTCRPCDGTEEYFAPGVPPPPPPPPPPSSPPPPPPPPADCSGGRVLVPKRVWGLERAVEEACRPKPEVLPGSYSPGPGERLPRDLL